jgi:two-component system heavy metal sensor histidine kinase CusS
VPSPDAAPTRRPALGLTERLVLGYVLAALFTLSAAAVFLYHTLYTSFEIEDAELLTDHVNTLRHELERTPQSLHEAEEIILSTATHRTLERYYGQLLDHTGKVLLETPGFSELVDNDAAFPVAAPKDGNISEVARHVSSKGIPSFLAAALVVHDPSNPPLAYHVALDVSHLEEWLGELRLQLILVVATGTALSGLLAWFLTHRGLEPVREITSTMKRVGAEGLDERLGGKPWPRELAAMAGEFDLMLQRLRDAFARQSQFTADVAHEFRTPLNNLVLSTSLTLSRDQAQEDYRQTLATHLEEYDRLKHMVESLLFIARADNAEASLTKVEVDTAALAEEVADFYSALAEDKGVMLTSSGEGCVMADASLLRMALGNLISNAIRHTPAGGKVSVMIAQEANRCLVSVADTGTGIAAEHLPRLFDRFYRVDSARSSQGSDAGAGLGLALVKTVVQLHGGTVTVSSTPGSGTTVEMRFNSNMKKVTN